MPWGNVDIIVGHTSQNQIDVLCLVATIQLKGLHLPCFCLFLFCEKYITSNYKIYWDNGVVLYLCM